MGELAELRPRDLNPAACMLTSSRVLIEVNPEFHPDGRKFLVRDYPKGKKHRRLKLSRQIVAKLTAQGDCKQSGYGKAILPLTVIRRPRLCPRHHEPGRPRQAHATG